jgi:hypothetical protein
VGDLNITAVAVLRYVDPSGGLPPSTGAPTSVDWSEPVNVGCKDLEDSALIPLVPQPLPSAPDQRVFFNMSGSFVTEGFRWTVNSTRRNQSPLSS